MRTLPKLFLGTTLLLTQLVAVFVFTGLASLVYSYAIADSYDQNGEPPNYFPLVAAVSGEPAGGYRLVPDEFDFWQGRENRMHDRLGYRRTESGWRIERFMP